MKSYGDYIDALDLLLKEAARLPRGGWSDLPRPKLSKDAPLVIIFSPHPDDEVFIGHLPLRLMRESKMRVTNVAVTLGSKKERRHDRLEELRKCCQYIGFELVSLDEDGLENINLHTRENNPSYWSQCVDRVSSILAKDKPEIIFYPHEQDWNTTHIGTHFLVVDSLKRMEPEFTCYCVETETWGFMSDPNLLIECNKKEVADLITALSFHRGEIERNRYHLRIAARLMDNVMRGAELVGGQGAKAPDIQLAILYRLKYWINGEFHHNQQKGRYLFSGDDPAELFKNIK